LASFSGRGVPTNSGRGSSIFSGISSAANVALVSAVDPIRTARRGRSMVRRGCGSVMSTNEDLSNQWFNRIREEEPLLGFHRDLASVIKGAERKPTLRCGSRKPRPAVTQTTKSLGSKVSIFLAAIPALTPRTVTAVANADSPGHASGVPLRIASKKFSRCG
jgi:hypothetical protein